MIELKDVSILQRAIDSISSFISEGNLRFNDNGISLKAIDPSQIVLVDFNVAKSAFEKYNVEPTLAGVDLQELNRIMSRALPNDKLLMQLTDSELNLKLEGDLSRSFSLPLIDVNEEEVKIPEAEFDAKVEISARVLKEALKDAGLFGSSVVLKVKDRQLFVEARGSAGTLHTIARQAKHITVKGSSEVVSKYSLGFLQNIVKDAASDEKISMQLKSDAPMKVSYKIGPAFLEFHLAHMIL
ncbi:MAG: proliferating cell nuclear antigen (pcna) [Candidatus Diapherotrites archaeon]|uniref:DNA polymerase sliding clamp n=1 Tax=Candidatus Iainarchaeum sp. TaxID=3101447 RepID=A0A938YXG7_9ARCH|nr:proliferating cell nuclear antigen (pcna) [Candidatus Diapherotrites archaeon]